MNRTSEITKQLFHPHHLSSGDKSKISQHIIDAQHQALDKMQKLLSAHENDKYGAPQYEVTSLPKGGHVDELNTKYNHKREIDNIDREFCDNIVVHAIDAGSVSLPTYSPYVKVYAGDFVPGVQPILFNVNESYFHENPHFVWDHIVASIIAAYHADIDTLRRGVYSSKPSYVTNVELKSFNENIEQIFKKALNILDKFKANADKKGLDFNSRNLHESVTIHSEKLYSAIFSDIKQQIQEPLKSVNKLLIQLIQNVCSEHNVLQSRMSYGFKFSFT